MKYFASVLVGLLIIIFNIPTFLIFFAMSVWHWDDKYFLDCFERVMKITDGLFKEE